jgi:hypothetical protein
MNTQQIARHLLNRRNAMNPAIFPGEMISSLGGEAMQEALQKRWLVPNFESGLLQISVEDSKIEEMRGVSDKCPTCGKVECGCAAAPVPNASHGYAFEHALRRNDGSALQEAVRASDARDKKPIQELLSPGTGHNNDSGLMRAPVSPTPSTPPATTAVPPKPLTTAAATAKPLGAAVKSPDGNLEIQLDPNDPASKKISQQLATAR